MVNSVGVDDWSAELAIIASNSFFFSSHCQQGIWMSHEEESKVILMSIGFAQDDIITLQ